MSQRVLIVDDAEDVVQLLTSKLIKAGFEVAVARDSDEALVQVRGFLPDVMLVNVLIPSIDCHTLIGNVVEAMGERRPVMLVISSRATDAEIREGLSCGADDFVLEPFIPNQVIHRIRVSLARRQLYGVR